MSANIWLRRTRAGQETFIPHRRCKLLTRTRHQSLSKTPLQPGDPKLHSGEPAWEGAFRRLGGGCLWEERSSLTLVPTNTASWETCFTRAPQVLSQLQGVCPLGQCEPSHPQVLGTAQRAPCALQEIPGQKSSRGRGRLGHPDPATELWCWHKTQPSAGRQLCLVRAKHPAAASTSDLTSIMCHANSNLCACRNHEICSRQAIHFKVVCSV